MIDMHSHVLPGVDDGAPDVETSLAMLKLAKEQGVDICVATPHCTVNSEEGVARFVERRRLAYEKLMQAIGDDKTGFPEIRLGAEVYLNGDLSEIDNINELCYKDTNYMLLEFSGNSYDEEMAEWVYNISTKGIRPVIAHIDRFPPYKEMMDDLMCIDNVIFQVNANRFMSVGDRFVLKNVFKRCDRVIVSSDMHNLEGRRCNLGDAYLISKKKFPRMTDTLFNDGAASILANREFLH